MRSTTDTRSPKAGIVLVAATVAMGLIAGLYYAWAISVMPGLAEVDDRAFVGALQQMDDAMVRHALWSPLFFASFLGALVLTGAAAHLQRRLGARRATPWIVAALVLYGIGFLTTMAINVPLNTDLADAGDPSRIADPAAVRDDFEDKWVAWHMVRTVLSTAALGCLAYALLLHGRAAVNRTASGSALDSEPARL